MRSSKSWVAAFAVTGLCQSDAPCNHGRRQSVLFVDPNPTGRKHGVNSTAALCNMADDVLFPVDFQPEAVFNGMDEAGSAFLRLSVKLIHRI